MPDNKQSSAFPWVNAGVQTGSNIFAQLFANRANRKMFEKQQQWSEEMWHMQNQYNHPAAVMQRLKEAGLNPNLAYGEIGAGMASSQPGMPSRPEIKPPGHKIEPLQEYQQYRMMEAQIANLEKDIEVKGSTITRNEFLNAETFMNKELKAEQKRALINELELQEMSWDDLVEVVAEGRQSVLEAERYIRHKADLSQQEIRNIQVEATRKYMKWIEANNLTKFIPLLNALIGAGVTTGSSKY
jgi:hypothetical protein